MSKRVKHVLKHTRKVKAQNIEPNIALLAKAYAFAKAGNAEVAGQLFVQASEEEALDGPMEALASSVDFDEEDYEDIDEITASDNGADDDMDGDDDDDDDDDMEDTEITEVELPASVARLAARVQF